MNIITLTCNSCSARSSNVIEDNQWRVETPIHEPWCQGDAPAPAEADLERAGQAD